MQSYYTLPKTATCHPMIGWDLLKGVVDIEFMQRGAQLDPNIQNKMVYDIVAIHMT